MLSVYESTDQARKTGSTSRRTFWKTELALVEQWRREVPGRPRGRD